MTPRPAIRLINVTSIVIDSRVLFVNILRSIISDLMSIIGPKIRNASMEPRLKVPTKDRAKKASIDEHIEITKASAIKAIIESDGDPTKLENTLRGMSI